MVVWSSDHLLTCSSGHLPICSPAHLLTSGRGARADHLYGHPLLPPQGKRRRREVAQKKDGKQLICPYSLPLFTAPIHCPYSLPLFTASFLCGLILRCSPGNDSILRKEKEMLTGTGLIKRRGSMSIIQREPLKRSCRILLGANTIFLSNFILRGEETEDEDSLPRGSISLAPLLRCSVAPLPCRWCAGRCCETSAGLQADSDVCHSGCRKVFHLFFQLSYLYNSREDIPCRAFYGVCLCVCFAFAFDIGTTTNESISLFESYFLILQNPGSITKYIPSIVKLASAIFVANIHFLHPGGAGSNITLCISDGNDEYIGNIINGGDKYSRSKFNNRCSSTNIKSKCKTKEIQRINLGSIVLLLKALGINDFLHFDFMDSPSIETLINSLENLYYLGALDENGHLTKLGKKMANFPMEPNLSKILLTSINFNCTDDVVTIVSMLSVQNIFYRPQNKILLADKKKNKFIMPQGDLITYLNIYNKWKENQYSNYWCHENFIHSRSLKRAQDVRKQLLSIFDKYNYNIGESAIRRSKNNRSGDSGNDSAKYINICKSICSGYFNHVCKRDNQQGYTTLLTNQQVFIHPSSTLFNKNPLFVVYHELVLTNKEYIRDCTIIQPQWLIQLAPNLFIPADEKEISKIKLREKIEPLHNYYEEPNAWRLSRRRG
ncbi:pre-mRNA-splicing factor ATP-dependent RNA helicase PRP22, putative (PRP22) [Plasmodium ovale wallikeri]|uniref:RNA helicase n=1 Tax=Plasmodium ovale wallikeri TaxID=864142 RepID=A0A1A8YNH6_PLAOA|nr:pre-mRNA-splicing factor ATP-dependent RNA helicase PRP22, putative (PRP22) [Plasmodium ovale wallikeri]